MGNIFSFNCNKNTNYISKVPAEILAKAQLGDADSMYKISKYIQAHKKYHRRCRVHRLDINKQSSNWIRKAAAQGHRDAIHSELDMYFRDIDPVVHQLGLRLIEECASEDCDKCIYLLGDYFYAGIKVKQDNWKALKWMYKRKAVFNLEISITWARLLEPMLSAQVILNELFQPNSYFYKTYTKPDKKTFDSWAGPRISVCVYLRYSKILHKAELCNVLNISEVCDIIVDYATFDVNRYPLFFKLKT